MHLQADIRKCEAQLQQWGVAQAAQRKRVNAQEAKVQRAQEKADTAAAAVRHHDEQVPQCTWLLLSKRGSSRRRMYARVRLRHASRSSACSAQ